MPKPWGVNLKRDGPDSTPMTPDPQGKLSLPCRITTSPRERCELCRDLKRGLQSLEIQALWLRGLALMLWSSGFRFKDVESLAALAF